MNDQTDRLTTLIENAVVLGIDEAAGAFPGKLSDREYSIAEIAARATAKALIDELYDELQKPGAASA
jgi:hypothetical protein